MSWFNGNKTKTPRDSSNTYNGVNSGARIEPVGPDMRRRSANEEVQIVKKIVNSPNSAEKINAIENSVPNVGALEPHNQKILISGMINTLREMSTDARFSDEHLARVANAVNRTENYMIAGHKAAITDLVIKEPRVGHALSGRVPNRTTPTERMESVAPPSSQLRDVRAKPVEVRFLGASQEAHLASSIANNPNPHAKAAQYALYSSQIGQFETKNKAELVRGALEMIKNGNTPASAAATVSDVLVKSQEHMSVGQRAELGELILKNNHASASLVDSSEKAGTPSRSNSPERTNSPNQSEPSNARAALLGAERSRDRSLGR